MAWGRWQAKGHGTVVFLTRTTASLALVETLGPAPTDLADPAGQPVDTTFVDVADSTVYLCPGNRSHYEFMLRQGFKVGWVRGGVLWDGRLRRRSGARNKYVDRQMEGAWPFAP